MRARGGRDDLAPPRGRRDELAPLIGLAPLAAHETTALHAGEVLRQPAFLPPQCLADLERPEPPERRLRQHLAARRITATTGSTALPTSAAAAAIARDVAAYGGVSTATATLAGARSAPTVHLDVAVETHPSVADLRDRITEEALPQLRTALQVDRLPAQLVLRLDAHEGTRRVR